MSTDLIIAGTQMAEAANSAGILSGIFSGLNDIANAGFDAVGLENPYWRFGLKAGALATTVMATTNYLAKKSPNVSRIAGAAMALTIAYALIGVWNGEDIERSHNEVVHEAVQPSPSE